MALKFAPDINETDLPEIKKFDELRAELRSEKKRGDVEYVKQASKRLYMKWIGRPVLLMGQNRDERYPNLRWVPVGRGFTVVFEISGNDMIILNIYHQRSQHLASR